MSIKRANASSVTKSGAGISDVPDAPTGLSATDSGDGTTASVSFTPAVTGGTATSYTVTSSPGSFTGTGASSPISVTGLSSGVAYTFTATATNSTGTSAASSASGSLTLASIGNYFLITRTTLGSSQSTVSFTSIPGTYVHLQLRGLARSDYSPWAGVPGFITFNSDSGANYANHSIRGYTGGTSDGASGGGGGSSYYSLDEAATAAGSPSTIFAPFIVDILDYANTNKFKTARGFSGLSNNTGSGPDIGFYSGLWRSTNAITTITITCGQSSTFTANSSFALYGIKGA